MMPAASGSCNSGRVLGGRAKDAGGTEGDLNLGGGKWVWDGDGVSTDGTLDGSGLRMVLKNDVRSVSFRMS